MSEVHRCPECQSERVVVSVITKYYVNGGEHYCFSCKSHDSAAPCNCLDCYWTGIQSDLVKDV